MNIVPRIIEKVSSLGAIISAMGCAACFPALGAFGASIGLGFLSAYEGVFINTLLPIFAAIALLSNLVNSFQHKVLYRGLLSILGPIAVLATLYPLWSYGWSTYLFYFGLVLMVVVSIFDIVKPAKAPQCPR